MTPLEIFLDIWSQNVPSVPYVETVNSMVAVEKLGDPWGGVIYQPAATDDATLGSHPEVEEKGTFLIGLFTKSGKGPAALDGPIAEVRRAFHGAARDGLHIEKVDGPHDVDPEADGEWWRIVLSASYTYYTKRDATGPLYGDWSGFPAAFP
jgi:Bacteriophage related domain of unknown function